MKAIKTFLICALAILTATISTPNAVLAQNTDASVAFVQRMGEKALSSLTARDLPEREREARVRELLRMNFDVDTIGRFALGTYWRSATDSEKREYLNLFEDMIVKTYTQRFAQYSGQAFEVGTAQTAGSKDMIVTSQILQKGGPPLAVDWRIRNSGKGLKVIDVIIEGISMSVTQRSDFAAVIQQGGGAVSTLNATLKDRVNTAKK